MLISGIPLTIGRCFRFDFNFHLVSTYHRPFYRRFLGTCPFLKRAVLIWVVKRVTCLFFYLLRDIFFSLGFVAVLLTLFYNRCFLLGGALIRNAGFFRFLRRVDVYTCGLNACIRFVLWRLTWDRYTSVISLRFFRAIIHHVFNRDWYLKLLIMISSLFLGAVIYRVVFFYDGYFFNCTRLFFGVNSDAIHNARPRLLVDLWRFVFRCLRNILHGAKVKKNVCRFCRITNARSFGNSYTWYTVAMVEMKAIRCKVSGVATILFPMVRRVVYDFVREKAICRDRRFFEGSLSRLPVVFNLGMRIIFPLVAMCRTNYGRACQGLYRDIFKLTCVSSVIRNAISVSGLTSIRVNTINCAYV